MLCIVVHSQLQLLESLRGRFSVSTRTCRTRLEACRVGAISRGPYLTTVRSTLISMVDKTTMAVVVDHALGVAMAHAHNMYRATVSRAEMRRRAIYACVLCTCLLDLGVPKAYLPTPSRIQTSRLGYACAACSPTVNLLVMKRQGLLRYGTVLYSTAIEGLPPSCYANLVCLCSIQHHLPRAKKIVS